jgi:hypothetical protein
MPSLPLSRKYSDAHRFHRLSETLHIFRFDENDILFAATGRPSSQNADVSLRAPKRAYRTALLLPSFSRISATLRYIRTSRVNI